MFRIIENVKAGIDNPSAIVNAMTSKRASNLDISDYKKIAPDDIFSVGINHLQGDNCEGRFLLSARNDGSLILHNIKNTSSSLVFKCECLWKCKDGHRFSVECVRWFPTDNGIFVSGGFDGKLKIWDTACLQCVETFTLKGKIYNFDLSPAITRNCTAAVCTSNGIVSLFELHSGTFIHTLKEHRGEVLSCNWSPFQEYILATGGTDNKVLLWDIRSAKSCLMSLNRYNTKLISCNNNSCASEFTAHNGSVNAVKFANKGLNLISCGTDNAIRLWDTMQGKNELVDYGSYENRSKRSVHIDISRNTYPELLYVPCADMIHVSEIDSGKFIKSLGGHFSNVNCCYYQPIQQELYSGCTDGIIIVWTDDNFETV